MLLYLQYANIAFAIFSYVIEYISFLFKIIKIGFLCTCFLLLAAQCDLTVGIFAKSSTPR